MNDKKNNNGRGIFYGVIGVATLVVAIIGATFAYFTATASNNNVITGNAASISFGLNVAREETTDQTNGGLIPMSNSMVEAALKAETPCKDDNGNSVCQIYKISLTNNSSASMFLDGYVTLTGGAPKDGTGSKDDADATTTMRWAQVFKGGSDEAPTYSTGGTTTLNADAENEIEIASIDAKSDTTGLNKTNVYGAEGGPAAVTGTTKISGNDNTVINKNYIRTSKHTGDAGYKRETDLTDALVFSQYLTASGTATANNDIYIVVWLHETGTNQTIDTSTDPKAGEGFFSGTVTFNSAQGGEVSATFSGYTTVPADTASTTTG